MDMRAESVHHDTLSSCKSQRKGFQNVRKYKGKAHMLSFHFRQTEKLQLPWQRMQLRGYISKLDGAHGSSALLFFVCLFLKQAKKKGEIHVYTWGRIWLLCLIQKGMATMTTTTDPSFLSRRSPNRNNNKHCYWFSYFFSVTLCKVKLSWRRGCLIKLCSTLM